MAEFNIERLEGEGITARVVDDGKLFSTYIDFARAVGYKDVVTVNGFEKPRALKARESEEFTVLAKGAHEYRHYGDVYVIESADGERFLMGEEGLKITYPHEGLTIEQASKSIEEIMRKVRREGYAEGYCDGKKRTRTNMLESCEATQEKRDRIVEQAKADIEGLIPESEDFEGMYYEVFHEGMSLICNAEFIVNKEKRTVVAVMKGYSIPNVYARGIAKCAPNDCFNVHIGRAIALRRALGLDVPNEYLNAPQPTEVRVGDKIRNKYTGSDRYYTKVIKEIDGSRVRYEDRGWDLVEAINRDARIIDDSRTD